MCGVFVNCLLKCSDFYLSVIAVLLLKVMVMFGVCGGFLCARPFIVFQSVRVSVLWSQLLSVMCKVLVCGFVFLCLC